MGQSFLAEVAHRIVKEIVDEKKDDLKNIAVVFNNQRPSIYLRKELGKLIDKPFFLPKMIGMNDLVSQLSSLEILPSEYLLFELYDVNRKINTTHSDDSFEDFISLGEIMLSDFSEIDLYCADAKGLFANLSDLKAIGEWNIDGSELTEFQKKYLAFFESLYSYYTELRKRLVEKSKAYSGMAYRKASDNVDDMIDCLPYDYVYFVGFNALSESEKRIVKAFITRRRGTLISNGDDYYYSKNEQEAGFFLRKQATELGLSPTYGNHFSGKKNINIVDCPENLLQTRYAAQRLAEIFKNKKNENEEAPQKEDADDTAVVLADEKLLVPMLNALPSAAKNVNVTIGYPYVYTSIHSLVSKLLELHVNGRGDDKERFYHTDITAIVSDPIIQTLTGDSRTPSQIDALLQNKKAVYATREQLIEYKIIGENIGFLFAPCKNDANAILDMWKECIAKLQQSKITENDRENTALSEWLLITKYFQDLQKQYSNHIGNVTTLQRIYGKFSKRCNLSLRGEPMQGVQLLGMLEARNLDFKNVILLSANEGILPAGRSINSLIPFNLKRHFNLPTYIEKDAVYANHFYCLIQRAENIDIVYTTESDGASKGKGELSRFALQVRDELANQYDKITVTQKVVKIEKEKDEKEKATATTPNDIIGTKTPKVMTNLKHYLSNVGISPSALNTYKDCPLNFYYKYVLGVSELDEFDEDMDAAGLGTCVHKILENTYKPTIGRPVTKDELEKAKNKCSEDVKKYFDKEMGLHSSENGRNYLTAHIAETEIKRFLQSEIDKITSGNIIQIEGTEQEIKGVTIEITDPENSEETIRVKCFGKIDRVEKIDGELRIADYKTGGVNPKDLSINGERDWTISEKRNKIPAKLTQVMFYAWAYTQMNPECASLKSGIYPLRSSNNDLIIASWFGKDNLDRETLETYKREILTPTLEEILDPKRPFAPIKKNAENGPCKYCPMVSLCMLPSKPTADVQGDDSDKQNNAIE